MLLQLQRLSWWQGPPALLEGHTLLPFVPVRADLGSPGGLTFRSTNQELASTLRLQGRQLILEIDTQEPRWQQYLIGFAFLSELGEPVKKGYAVLRPTATDHFGTRIILDAQDRERIL